MEAGLSPLPKTTLPQPPPGSPGGLEAGAERLQWMFRHLFVEKIQLPPRVWSQLHLVSTASIGGQMKVSRVKITAESNRHLLNLEIMIIECDVKILYMLSNLPQNKDQLITITNVLFLLISAPIVLLN